MDPGVWSLSRTLRWPLKAIWSALGLTARTMLPSQRMIFRMFYLIEVIISRPAIPRDIHNRQRATADTFTLSKDVNLEMKKNGTWRVAFGVAV